MHTATPYLPRPTLSDWYLSTYTDNRNEDMRKPDWRRLLHLPKRSQVPTPGSSPGSHSPPSTMQEAPISVVEPILPPAPPTATAHEVPTSNPEPVLSVPPTTPALLPPERQDTPISVPGLVSTLTPPLTTITTNREVPVLAIDPGAGSSPSPPAKSKSASSIGKIVGNGLVVGLKLLKEAVTGVGVPGLEATVSGIVGVIDLIQDVGDNADDLGDLNGLISNLAHTIGMSPDLHQGVKEVPGVLRSRIDMFLSGLHELMMEVQTMLRDKNPVIRAANSQVHRKAIEDVDMRINFLLNQFTAQGTLSLELNMVAARQDIQLLAQAQEALALAREYEDLIKAIPRAGARYNDTTTKPSRSCHPGTRTELLEIIVKWIVDDPDAKPYFWLCGEVGVGKTTVAHTIALEQQSRKRLGASFFFSRHDDSRRSPHLLFTSIAYQLARFDHGFYKALAETLKPDPDIVKRTPAEQFRQLVLEPLARSGIGPARTVVIVIDGLDECSDAALVLDVLTQGIDNVGVRLRVLISSRPYAAILSKFEDARLCHLTSETKFRDIDPESLSQDVAAYLSWSLGDLALRWRLPSPWPPKAQLDELIERAGGLIIIASTYTKYIDDPEVGNPLGQLVRILSRRRKVGSSPLAELDNLYDQVLDDLKSRLRLDAVMARDLLDFIIHGEGEINVQLLAGILSVDPSDVRLVLRHLTAVIPLPKHDEDAIVPFHASFGEYIQDSTRCTVRELSADSGVAHGRMAIQCSDAIASVMKDGIIGVEYESARGYSWIPAYLKHAVKHLNTYLSRSPPAQVEEVERIIIGTGIWRVFCILSTNWGPINPVKVVDAAGGFEDLLHLKGSSEHERSTSLGILMIANLASEIKRRSEQTAAARGAITVESSQIRRQQALKFVQFVKPAVWDEFRGVLRILGNALCWMKYTHRHVMSFDGVDVKFDDNNVPQEVLVSVASPCIIQRSSSLLGYLERVPNLDLGSRARMALGVADGLRYLHESSPPQPYNGVAPHQIMVSEEEQPILYPSTWNLDWQSMLPPEDKDDANQLIALWEPDWFDDEWDHWGPTGRGTWMGSLEARLQVDIWDFGSLLYQMLTGEEPLTTYIRLAEGNEELGYDPTQKTVPEAYWTDNGHYKSRYETAVSVLLDTLQASADAKGLFKSCWAIRGEDRPPMGEVFQRLKAIVADMET